MSEFAIIPVIDLKAEAVVHAKGGKRADYKPIETTLGSPKDPIAIARALLAITESPALYVADLDAIEGIGDHFDLCRELADALPGTMLWIDAGFSDVTDCAFWLPLGAALVIGSESLSGIGVWREFAATFGKSLVLSLDYADGGLVGPLELTSEQALWPDRVLAMNLVRVGTEAGPDLDLLKSVLVRAGACSVYAAGGVREIGDLEAIADLGGQGVLLASALHSGAIGQNEIAAFLRRRRSQS